MEYSYNGKTLNTQKLLNSDFIDRLFGFAEAYDKFRNFNSLSSLKEWLKNEDYPNIMYFLFTTNIEYLVAFSIDEFVALSEEEFYYYHKFYSELAALLDEKKSLYEEFLLFYE